MDVTSAEVTMKIGATMTKRSQANWASMSLGTSAFFLIVSAGETKADEKPVAAPAVATKSKAVESHPALIAVAERLREVLKTAQPKATVEIRGDEIIAEYQTQKFMVHRRDMIGAISAEAHQELGPNYQGFLLRLRLSVGALVNMQAFLPQELSEPYWKTYIARYNLRVVEAGIGSDDYERHVRTRYEHLQMAFSYGSRSDQKLIEQIKETVASYAKEALSASADKKKHHPERVG